MCYHQDSGWWIVVLNDILNFANPTLQPPAQCEADLILVAPSTVFMFVMEPFFSCHVMCRT
jgi:hypothetical protein